MPSNEAVPTDRGTLRPPRSRRWESGVSTRRGASAGRRSPPGSQDDAALKLLTELGLQALAPIGRWRTYERGAAVLRQSDRVTAFSVLTAGRVKACCESAEGNGLILGLYGPGDVVGFAASLCELRQQVSVIAVEPLECFEVDRQALFWLLGERSELIGELLPRLARSLVGCTNCPAPTIHRHVEPRLASLFLRILERASDSDREKGWISLHLSRQELAQLAGTTTESVSRVMSRWREGHILVTADDGFWVRDRQRLEQIARSRRASPSSRR